MHTTQTITAISRLLTELPATIRHRSHSPIPPVKFAVRRPVIGFFQLGCVLFLFYLSITAHADGLKQADILTIDKPVVSHTELFFPDQDDKQPDKSDIKIVSYILLSSKSGQRWATLTLENLSRGQRIFTNNHILAVFANGDKKSPLHFKQKFSSREKITLNLNFGINKNPILSVYTNN